MMAAASTVGLGFSGAGFLIAYFIGAAEVLISHNIITPGVTRVAGSSSGGLMAAALCSNVSTSLLLNTTQGSTLYCRDRRFCAGVLESQVRNITQAVLPPDVAQRCNNTGWIGVSVLDPTGRGQQDAGQLVGSFTDRADLLETTAATAYIPFWSGPTATTPWRGQRAYDGGFTVPLPCPPRVGRCIRISSTAYNATQANTSSSTSSAAAPPRPRATNVTADWERSAPQLVALAVAARGASSPPPDVRGAINPGVVEQLVAVDLQPGKFGRLPVPGDVWNSFSLRFPNESVLQQVYQLGRTDAELWVQEAWEAGGWNGTG